MIPRRTILTGIIAAPLIVRSGLLMPVRALPILPPVKHIIPAYFDARIESGFWDELDMHFLAEA